MKTFHAAVAASVLAFSAGAANAATYTIEDFGAKKPTDPYYSQGYVYDPANGVNGQCFDDGNPGTWCIKEAGTQDFLTTIDTDPNVDPDQDDLFTLLGFYVNLDGKGSQEGTDEDPLVNFLRVTDGSGGSSVLTLGLNFDYINDPNFNSLVSIYTVEDDPMEVSFLDKRSEGFWVIIESGFQNVNILEFQALGSANVRVDCVALTQDSQHDFGGIGDIKTCTPTMRPPNVIPLPAAGWLLIAGLGGLAALKRRKAA